MGFSGGELFITSGSLLNLFFLLISKCWNFGVSPKWARKEICVGGEVGRFIICLPAKHQQVSYRNTNIGCQDWHLCIAEFATAVAVRTIRAARCNLCLFLCNLQIWNRQPNCAILAVSYGRGGHKRFHFSTSFAAKQASLSLCLFYCRVYSSSVVIW